MNKTKNYIETRQRINKYFKFKHDFDFLSLDFLTKFMWSDEISYEQFCKILYFTFLFEYACTKEKRNEFLEVVSSQILDSNVPFKFNNDYYVSDILDKSEIDTRGCFCNMFMFCQNFK